MSQLLCRYPINPEKFPINSINKLRNLSKKLKTWLRSRTIGNGMKILENFRVNRLEFVEKFKIINI